MKRSIKFIATAAAVVALFFSTNSSAQTSDGDSKDTRLGVGLSLGIPTHEFFNFAVGGDLKLQKDFYSNVSGTASIGYTNFSAEGEDAGSIGFIPLKAGIKVFPLERFYLSGEIGAGFGTDDNQPTSFVWSPGIGLGFNNGLDLGLRYERFSKYDLGQVALRIAYGFNLSR
ncbi:outer membrane beta-barrel protein [Pedobacter sp. SYSU D00535]|uniref:outer membrane beta-barrel protein n=1 Tax=Pedobacter sp. SYSU D00535 TaxID=2810308 RepID=UPI001A95AFC0|nr:outer membrane beta-barrel protein [Pedobacter sp. SYSU D00535]